MSDTLTDEHYDWASNFCGIPTQDPPEPTQSAEPAEPNQSIQAPAPEPAQYVTSETPTQSFAPPPEPSQSAQPEPNQSTQPAEPMQSVAPPEPNQSVEPEPNQSVQPPPEPNQSFAPPSEPSQSVEESPPPPVPAIPRAPLSEKQLFDMGFSTGKAGSMPICPETDARGEAAYEAGLAAGKQEAARKVQDDIDKMPSARQSKPGEIIETRGIRMLSDDGVGVVTKRVTGSRDELDRRQEVEDAKILKQEWNNLTGIGKTPVR